MAISYILQGDMTLSDSDIGSNNIVTWDIGISSTGDMGNFKEWRHATLAFLKFDMRHQDPPALPAKGPYINSRPYLYTVNVDIFASAYFHAFHAQS